jgi:hypothetical protein
VSDLPVWLNLGGPLGRPFLSRYTAAMLLAHLEYVLDDSIMTQRTLRLRVGAGDVAQTLDRVAGKLQKTAVVPGFRKGRAPLARVRAHLQKRVAAEAFQELKRAALDQVLPKLGEADRPFIPPEVLDAEKVRLKYGQALEFAVKYLIDPSGMGRNPQQPQFEQGAVMPGAAAMAAEPSTPGLVRGPQLPAVPGMPSG